MFYLLVYKSQCYGIWEELPDTSLKYTSWCNKLADTFSKPPCTPYEAANTFPELFDEWRRIGSNTEKYITMIPLDITSFDNLEEEFKRLHPELLL